MKLVQFVKRSSQQGNVFYLLICRDKDGKLTAYNCFPNTLVIGSAADNVADLYNLLDGVDLVQNPISLDCAFDQRGTVQCVLVK